jgi:GNAT superfamily N-acetyltransferase
MTTIYHLEMTDKPATKAQIPAPLTINEIKTDQPLFNRFLYELVGTDWQWTDKSALSDKDWAHYVCRTDLRTWVAYYEGAIAGYFELEKQNNQVELKYFGLVKEFIGKGFGRPLLTYAIEQAWKITGIQRVWVHTCSLDHPNALNNYQKCGFRLYKTEQE